MSTLKNAFSVLCVFYFCPGNYAIAAGLDVCTAANSTVVRNDVHFALVGELQVYVIAIWSIFLNQIVRTNRRFHSEAKHIL